MAYVRLRVGGLPVTALVDTGYDGFLVLPDQTIERLKLPQLYKTRYMTADGQTHEGRVHRGEIEHLGQSQSIPIDSTGGDFSLVGMKLLWPLRFLMEPSRDLLELSTPPSASAGP